MADIITDFCLMILYRPFCALGLLTWAWMIIDSRCRRRSRIYFDLHLFPKWKGIFGYSILALIITGCIIDYNTQWSRKEFFEEDPEQIEKLFEPLMYNANKTEDLFKHFDKEKIYVTIWKSETLTGAITNLASSIGDHASVNVGDSFGHAGLFIHHKDQWYYWGFWPGPKATNSILIHYGVPGVTRLKLPRPGRIQTDLVQEIKDEGFCPPTSLVKIPAGLLNIAEVVAWANDRQGSGDSKYKLKTSDCADFTQKLLNAGGLPVLGGMTGAGKFGLTAPQEIYFRIQKTLVLAVDCSTLYKVMYTLFDVAKNYVVFRLILLILYYVVLKFIVELVLYRIVSWAMDNPTLLLFAFIILGFFYKNFKDILGYFRNC